MMSSINKLIDTVLSNANRVELQLMKQGDLSVAVWLVSKCADLTPTQTEAVAFRILESIKQKEQLQSIQMVIESQELDMTNVAY